MWQSVSLTTTLFSMCASRGTSNGITPLSTTACERGRRGREGGRVRKGGRAGRGKRGREEGREGGREGGREERGREER